MADDSNDEVAEIESCTTASQVILKAMGLTRDCTGPRGGPGQPVVLKKLHLAYGERLVEIARSTAFHDSKPGFVQFCRELEPAGRGSRVYPNFPFFILRHPDHATGPKSGCYAAVLFDKGGDECWVSLNQGQDTTSQRPPRELQGMLGFEADPPDGWAFAMEYATRTPDPYAAAYVKSNVIAKRFTRADLEAPNGPAKLDEAIRQVLVWSSQTPKIGKGSKINAWIIRPGGNTEYLDSFRAGSIAHFGVRDPGRSRQQVWKIAKGDVVIAANAGTGGQEPVVHMVGLATAAGATSDGESPVGPQTTPSIIKEGHTRWVPVRWILLEKPTPGTPADEGWQIVRGWLRPTLHAHQGKGGPLQATMSAAKSSGDLPSELTKLRDILGKLGAGAQTQPYGTSTAAPSSTDIHCVRRALGWPVAPHCIIFEGVPGTGKTYRLKKIKEADESRIGGDGDGRYAATLHPATAYEDFVEGLRPAKASLQDAMGSPTVNASYAGAKLKVGRRGHGGKLEIDPRQFYFAEPASDPPGSGTFTLNDGFFVSICIEAANKPTREFAVLLDELNRCNIPKVMGDLLTTLESSKRARWCSTAADANGRCWTGEVNDGFWDITDAQVVTLPYSRRLFFVPDNVYVIGTMNTTDRSVAPMDAALRRRFAFERVWPIGFEPPLKGDRDSVVAALKGKPERSDWERLEALLDPTIGAWIRVNEKLQDFGDDAMLGHSYLFDLARDLGDPSLCGAKDENAQKIIEYHWNKHIFPQLVDSLLSNDLIDGVFDEPAQTAKESPKGIPSLGLGSTSGWTVDWALRGAGLMRIPTITLKVDPTKTAEKNQAKGVVGETQSAGSTPVPAVPAVGGVVAVESPLGPDSPEGT